MFAAVWIAPVVPAHAQFLRLGPFDIAAETGLEGIYTTNVEYERPSVAKQPMEDYYAVWTLDMNTSAGLVRNSNLNLDTGLSVERHARREDLDNDKEPFGHVDLTADFDLGHLTLSPFFKEQRSAVLQGDYGFVPGDQKQRDVNTTHDAGANLKWEREDLTVTAGYDYYRERHQDEEFQNNDQNKQTISFGAAWQMSKRLSLGYDYSRYKTEYVTDTDTNETVEVVTTNDAGEVVTGNVSRYQDWQGQQDVGLTLKILEKPNLDYTFGLQKLDENGEENGWEPTHTIDISQDFKVAENLKVTGAARYTNEKKKSENDIGFTYSIQADHEISRTARQRFSAQRTPVNTFGSTTDTDNTTLDWMLTKEDLFLYNLTMTLDVSYTIDKPMGSNDMETEKKWSYDFMLTHTRALSRKLQRTLSYEYRRENSDLQDEVLDENRVTLGFDYTF